MRLRVSWGSAWLWFPWQVLCGPREPREAQRGHNGPATHSHQRRPAGRDGTGAPRPGAPQPGPPPALPTPGRMRGPPRAGVEAGRRPILVGRWWFWHRAAVGTRHRRGCSVVQEPDPAVPPCSRFPLFSDGFSSTWGGFLSYFPTPFRDCLAGEAPCPGSPHTPLYPLGSCTDPREPADQPKTGPRPGKTWSPNHCCKPSAAEQRRGSGQCPSTPRPQQCCRPGHATREGPITATHTCEVLRVITSFFLFYSIQSSS